PTIPHWLSGHAVWREFDDAWGPNQWPEKRGTSGGQPAAPAEAGGSTANPLPASPFFPPCHRGVEAASRFLRKRSVSNSGEARRLSASFRRMDCSVSASFASRIASI